MSKYRFLMLILVPMLVFFFIPKLTNAQDLEKSQLLDLISPNDIVGETIINDTVYFNYLGGPITLDRTILSENTEQISPNTYKIYSGKSFEYYNGNWNYFEYATTTLFDYNERYVDKLGFRGWLIPPATAQTIYTSGTSDGDGYNSDTNWDTAHNATTADGWQNTSAQAIAYCGKSGSDYYNGRSMFCFDTSGYSGYTVSSSTFGVFSYGCGYGSELDYNITEATPADPDDVVTGDYDGMTVHNPDLGSDWVDCDSRTYYDFKLNATGTSWIDLEGDTCFALRCDKDINDTAPTLDRDIRLYFAEYTGTANDPFITLVLEEEEATSTPTASSTVAETGSIPIFNDIAIISGYTEIYTDSTTTPSEVRYHAYHIPFFVFVVLFAIFMPLLLRFLLELIIRLRN